MSNFSQKINFAALSVFFFMLCFAKLCFAQEEITLTTYYPAPYGVYVELRAQRIAIGDGYIDAAAPSWEDGTIDSEADLVIEGNVGIGTDDPLASLHISSDESQDLFRVDDATGDTTPFTIDDHGRVGIRRSSSGAGLAVDGGVDIDGGLDFEPRVGTTTQGRITNLAMLYMDNGDLILTHPSQGDSSGAGFDMTTLEVDRVMSGSYMASTGRITLGELCFDDGSGGEICNPLGATIAGSLDVTDLAGPHGGGSAYVCVDDNGLLFASEGVCP